MPRYALLLRAVNLPGHNRLTMPELRRLLEDRGYDDVETYLASGNAVVTAAGDDPAAVGRDVADALREAFGLDTAVLVRDHADLAAVVADNPFPQALERPTTVHVAFLSAEPDPAAVAAIPPDVAAPDEFRFAGRHLYLHYPNGAGRSKLGPAVFKGLDVAATSRNWNTVTALAGMTAG